MGRARIVIDEVRQALANRKIDIALAQEPYTYQKQINNFGGSLGVVKGDRPEENFESKRVFLAMYANAKSEW